MGIRRDPLTDATVQFSLHRTPHSLPRAVIRSQSVINLSSPFQGIKDGKQSVLSAARLLSWAGESKERAGEAGVWRSGL